MMTPRQSLALVVLCGTCTLAGWGAGKYVDFGSSASANATAIFIDRGATSSRGDRAPLPSLMASAAPAATLHLKLPEPVKLAALFPAHAAPAAAATADPVPHAAAADPVPHEVTATPAAMTVGEADIADQDAGEATFVLASVNATETPVFEDTASATDASPPPESRPRLVSLFRPDTEPEQEEPKQEDTKPVVVRYVEPINECLVADICIDDYLWAMYERTPKIDTNKLTSRVKATVKVKGKMRTVTKTVTKYVLGDFTWKDPIAAQRVGMSLKDYVIGGMDRSFRHKLYYAMRAMDDAGLMPGITSAFRDDYRQAIAVGKKAASDGSFHGGSRRVGGYGHGLAADVVSVRGATRTQRFASTVEMWKWIDANEKQLGIGRPYLDRDPPHVGPINGREFVAKRGGRSAVQTAALQTKKAQQAKLTAKKTLAAKTGPKKVQLAKLEPKTQVAKLEPKAQAAKPAPKAQAAKPEPRKPQAAKPEPRKPQQVKLETRKPQAARTSDAGAAAPKPAKLTSLQSQASVQH
jgi:hypothetical protein